MKDSLVYRVFYSNPEVEAAHKSGLLYVPALRAYVKPAPKREEAGGALLFSDSRHYPSGKELASQQGRKVALDRAKELKELDRIARKR